MSFKNKVRLYLGQENQINEMALKDLKGTEKDWEAGDLEAVADGYIENALKDYDKGKYTKQQRLVNIKRGLTTTFKSKKFEGREGDAGTLRDLIRDKVDELIKVEKAGKLSESTKKQLKGKCSSCGETVRSYEDEDYDTSWIAMDDGREFCGDCGAPTKGSGTRYHLRGSMGLDTKSGRRFKK